MSENLFYYIKQSPADSEALTGKGCGSRPDFQSSIPEIPPSKTAFRRCGIRELTVTQGRPMASGIEISFQNDGHEASGARHQTVSVWQVRQWSALKLLESEVRILPCPASGIENKSRHCWPSTLVGGAEALAKPPRPCASRACERALMVVSILIQGRAQHPSEAHKWNHLQSFLPSKAVSGPMKSRNADTWVF